MPAEPINLFDFEAIAEHKIVKVEWDYIAGAAQDEITLHRTRSAYDHIALRPRVLTGTAGVDLSTTVLGQKLRSPSCSRLRAATRRRIQTASLRLPAPLPGSAL
jgi:4-hydroxymandelate oxidase